MRRELRRYGWLALVGAAALALPLALPGNYALFLAVIIGINTIVALGLNLLMGYAGQVSLGQAAFVGVGAYTSAILTTKLGVSPLLGILAGVLLGALVGAVVGVPLLKLRGHYLAMGTLGFGMIVQIVLVQWENLTEGTIGIMSIPPIQVAGLAFDSELRMYYLVACSVIVCMGLAYNVIGSRVGRAMRAVHGSEVAAETAGVDTARYKLQVFILSAAMAAYAGCLYAHHSSYVHPSTFGFHYSIHLVVMVVIGGMASIGGAIFGAGSVSLIAEYLRSFQEYSTIGFGLVLLIIMIFLPSGLWRGTADLLRSAAAARSGALRALRGGR